ncbi:MAG: PilZ domain-containing protein [Anaeromyxobacter sp.]
MATVRPEERRRFSRVPYQSPAQLLIGTRSFVCGVHDVSLKGVLLDSPGPGRAKLGQPCRVVIDLGGGGEVIQLQGTVAHVEAGTVGVRCTGIDLEGLSRLRRLLELNLGDEALLHRELGALVRSH